MAIELTAEQRERLRLERERLGLTQTEVANRAGTVSQYINQLESGKKRTASPELLKAIGDVLGLEITVSISIKKKRRK